MTRYLVGFMCVLALGVMPLVGCSETAGGSGGTAGSGGGGGVGGADSWCAFNCNDGNSCTEDQCDPTDGTCSYANRPEDSACGVSFERGVCDDSGQCVECNRDAQCDDFNDCTVESCDSENVCSDPTEVVNGVECAGGTCQNGVCELTSTVLPCIEQGIRNAIAAGGGPYRFDCDGPQTVVTQARIVIDNNVILDGEGNLTVDGNEEHGVFTVREGVTTQLRRLTVSGGVGFAIESYGMLSLTSVTVSGRGTCRVKAGAICWAGAIMNGTAGGTLTLTNSTVTGDGVGILNTATLTLTNSTVAGDSDGIFNAGGTLTLTNSLVDGGCYLEGPDNTSNGYNIESPGDTCGFDQLTDQVNVSADDLKLGPLQDNGGSTMTHALLPGSVAIDVIPEAECLDADGEPLTTDQRGQPRPVGATCDVGSFEVQPPPAESCLQSGGTVSTGLCCQAVEFFPNTCTTGACGCAPDASHEVDVCICPTNTCFDGESCVAQ